MSKIIIILTQYHYSLKHHLFIRLLFIILFMLLQEQIFQGRMRGSIYIRKVVRLSLRNQSKTQNKWKDCVNSNLQKKNRPTNGAGRGGDAGE